MNIPDNKEVLQEIVNKSRSIRECLINLGVNSNGSGNYRTFKKYCQKYGIIPPDGHAPRLEKLSNYNRTKIIPLELCLIENSSYKNNSALKKKLIKAGALKNVCSECGVGGIWNNKPLSLQMDHINGNHTDNRLINLRLLCPNCHTQTDTYGSKRKKKDDNHCHICGKKINRVSKKCCHCETVSRTKITWPPLEELNGMISGSSKSAVARMLGVSPTSINRYIRRMG